MTQETVAKKILFVMRQAPHQTSQPQEAFDILLMAGSFAYEINLLFISDGLFQLIKQQDPQLVGKQNFTTAYKALALYDINNVYIAKNDLAARGLAQEDLFLTTTALTDSEISHLMQQQATLFNF